VVWSFLVELWTNDLLSNPTYHPIQSLHHT
jgi:hypothetical protein